MIRKFVPLVPTVSSMPSIPPTLSIQSAPACGDAALSVLPALPALNGRSVRNLRHLRAVRSARTFVAAAATVLAIAVGAGLGVPAYAAATAPIPEPKPQVVAVKASAQIPPVQRDSYTATAPPALAWPVENYASVTDGYGPRTPPCSGCSSFHGGVDLAAGYGNPVRSIAKGVVIETSSPFNTSLGVHVTIQHVIDGQIVTSLYGHMQYGSMPLKVGDTVYTGQQIGLIGSTGASTGAHLHFEIHPGGDSPVNPMSWMHARLG